MTNADFKSILKTIPPTIILHDVKKYENHTVSL